MLFILQKIRNQLPVPRLSFMLFNNMNIFVTNSDPVVAARELCDQHCRSKMMIESAIMLQNCFTNEQLEHESCPRTKTGKVRKSGKGYSKHQCTLWVKESRENFLWLVNHALEMFNERNYRWVGSPEHFTKQFILWCLDNKNITQHKSNNLTSFTTAIGIDSTCRQIPGFDSLPVTEQYQRYIVHDKPFATWTKRNKPGWFN